MPPSPATPAPARWQVGALRTSVQILLAICVIAGALWILHRVESVLLVLALSVLFAHLVAPVVAFFRRPVSLFHAPRAMPATVAILAAYLAIFGTLAAAGTLILPVLTAQFTDFRAELPGYVIRFEAGWQRWLKGQTRMLPSDVRGGVEGTLSQASASVSRYVQGDFLPRVGGWLMNLPWLILVPIFAFFLLRDADELRRAALGLFPGRQLRWRGDVFFEDVNRTLAAYIRAQLLASIVVAILCTGGFVWIGLQYGVVLGIAAGLLELLPLVGPLMIAAVAVAVGGLESMSRALTTAAFVLCVRIAQDYFIYPRLVGREIPLHPMAVILAILCGGEIAGVAGIFLAVPMLAITTVAFRHWRAHRAAEPPRPAVVER